MNNTYQQYSSNGHGMDDPSLSAYGSAPSAGPSADPLQRIRSPGSETTSSQQPSPPVQPVSSHQAPPPYYQMKPEQYGPSAEDMVRRAAEGASTNDIGGSHQLDSKGPAEHGNYTSHPQNSEVPVLPYIGGETPSGNYGSIDDKQGLSLSMIPPASDGVSSDNMGTPSNANMTTSGNETGDGGDPHADARHSCHQCKTRRPNAEMYYCNNHPPSGRKSKKLDADGNPLPAPPNPRRKRRLCRKKYCGRCLIKFYRELPPRQSPSVVWCCPSCRGVCTCAICRRRSEAGQRSTTAVEAAAEGATNMAAPSNAVEPPSYPPPASEEQSQQPLPPPPPPPAAGPTVMAAANAVRSEYEQAMQQQQQQQALYRPQHPSASPPQSSQQPYYHQPPAPYTLTPAPNQHAGSQHYTSQPPQHVSQSQPSSSVPPLPTIYNNYPPGPPNQHQGYPPHQQQPPHYYVNNPQTPNTPSQPYAGYSLGSPQGHYPPQQYTQQPPKQQT